MLNILGRALLEATRMASSAPPQQETGHGRFAPLYALRGRMRRARSRRKTVGLSDWLLRDIGLSRVSQHNGRPTVRPDPRSGDSGR